MVSAFQSFSFSAFPIEFSVHLRVEAVDFTGAGERDEFHFPGVTRFKANGRSCGNIQAKASRCGAVETQRLVGLEEMVMRADLNWTIARVRNDERYCGEIKIRSEWS